MKTKKFISLILVVLMLMPTNFVMAQTDLSDYITFKRDDFYFDTQNQNKITGIKDSGRNKINSADSKKIIIPDDVEEIGDGVFESAGLIGFVGRGVTKIGSRAFYSCSLEYLEVPNLQDVGQSAFANNRLTELKQDKLTIVREHAFENNRLTKIELPNVERILESGFCKNSITGELKLDKLVYLGDDAFYNNNRITQIDFPLVEEIGSKAFYNHQSGSVTSVNLPKVKKIGHNAFYANKIEILSLPEATLVGSSAFYNNNIKEINGPKIVQIVYDTFRQNKIEKLYLPELKDVGPGAFSNNNIKEINLPKVKNIFFDSSYYGAFERNKIEKISLPNVKQIGRKSFSSNNIRDFRYINKNAAIASNAFDNQTIDIKPAPFIFSVEENSLYTRNGFIQYINEYWPDILTREGSNYKFVQVDFEKKTVTKPNGYGDWVINLYPPTPSALNVSPITEGDTKIEITVPDVDERVRKIEIEIPGETTIILTSSDGVEYFKDKQKLEVLENKIQVPVGEGVLRKNGNIKFTSENEISRKSDVTASVLPKNEPILYAISERRAYEGDEFNIPLNVKYFDNTTLKTVNLENKPDFVNVVDSSLKGTAHKINWTGEEKEKVYEMNVTVTDTNNRTSNTQKIKITILRKTDIIESPQNPTPLEGYARVTFTGGDNGYVRDKNGFKKDKIYDVLLSEKKNIGDLTPPTVEPKYGYYHTGWDKEDSYLITQDTTVTATYDTWIIENPQTPTPLEGYARVTFDAGKGHFKGGQKTKTIDVLISQKKTLGDIKKPHVLRNDSFLEYEEFLGWDKEDSYLITEDVTINAVIVLALITDPTTERPLEGYTRIEYKTDPDKGTLEGTKIYDYANEYISYIIKEYTQRESEIPKIIIGDLIGIPKVIANLPYYFIKWDKDLYTTELKINQNIVINAVYSTAIVENPTTEKPEEGFIRLTFKSDENGQIIGKDGNPVEKYVVDFLKEARVKYKDVPKPTVKSKEGYTFIDRYIVFDPNSGTVEDAYILNQYSEQIQDEVLNEAFSNLELIAYNHQNVFYNPEESTPKENYVRVTFEDGGYGTISGNVVADVFVPAELKLKELEKPKVEPEMDYEHTGWDRSENMTIYRDIFLKALYRQIPKPNIIPGSEEKPEGYVTVEFKIDETKGSFKGETKYYVNPDGNTRFYDMEKPQVNTKEYIHVAWDTNDLEKITKDLVVNAVLVKDVADLPAIIDGDLEKPEGYITVEFKADPTKGTVTGKSKFHVNPEKFVKIGDLVYLYDIKVKVKDGYKFTDWSDSYWEIIKRDTKDPLVVIANFEQILTPEEPVNTIKVKEPTKDNTIKVEIDDNDEKTPNEKVVVEKDENGDWKNKEDGKEVEKDEKGNLIIPIPEVKEGDKVIVTIEDNDEKTEDPKVVIEKDEKGDWKKEDGTPVETDETGTPKVEVPEEPVKTIDDEEIYRLKEKIKEGKEQIQTPDYQDKPSNDKKELEDLIKEGEDKLEEPTTSEKTIREITTRIEEAIKKIKKDTIRVGLESVKLGDEELIITTYPARTTVEVWINGKLIDTVITNGYGTYKIGLLEENKIKSRDRIELKATKAGWNDGSYSIRVR